MQNFEIQIGKARDSLLAPKWVADWQVKDAIERSANVPMTLDGTLHYGNVYTWLRPEVNFTLNFASVDDYAEAEKIFVEPFVLRFYHPVLKRLFSGLFTLTSSSVVQFLRGAGDIYLGVANYFIKAKSIYTYDNYEHLAQKAEFDPRF